MAGNAAKNWTITLFVTSTVETITQLGFIMPELFSDLVSYFVCQCEKCPLTGKKHIQGYIQLKDKKRLSQLKKIFPGHAHLEIARGSPTANKTYCTKEDSRIGGPWESGQMTDSGTKRKLDEIGSEIEQGLITDVDQVPASLLIRHGPQRFAEAINRAVKPGIREVKVLCLVGPTRIGKSYLAHKLFPDLITASYGNNGVWWSDYVKQDVILLDEFKCQMKLQTLLQLLDVYPIHLETKGGSVWAHFTKVIICTNTDPAEWYLPEQGKEDNRKGEREALFARLGYIERPGAPTRGLTLNYLQTAELFGRTELGIQKIRADMEVAAMTHFGMLPYPNLDDDDETVEPTQVLIPQPKKLFWCPETPESEIN